jgi:hypothetical protein
MPALPLFHRVLPLSLQAVMLFPHDMVKARAWVGWQLARGPLRALYEYEGVELPYAAALEVAEDATRAASWPDFSNEVERNRFAGDQVGFVVYTLWLLICQDPKAASWERAIEAAVKADKAEGTKTGRRGTVTSTIKEHLREFSPVLHLLGAWNEPRTRNRRFIQDPAVGYTYEKDADYFVAEAQLLLCELRKWHAAPERRHIPSAYLNTEKFEVGPEWQPPDYVEGWPMTGGLPGGDRFPEDHPAYPARRARGRPSKV